MTGGTIKSCKVDLGGLGMAVYGSNDKAVVTMTGGTFEDCGAYPYSFDEFTVTFDSDGGSAVTAQKVLNSPAIKPADPTKNEYLFAGWYLEDMQYAFDTTVTTDITLKAHWTPTSASTAITAATIQDVNFNYQPGDAPRATAAVAAADQGKYRIADEWWQELNENDVPVAIWHSDDGIYSTLPTITAFESGKKYVYSVLLLPERGYDFGREVAATVNGSTVTAVPGTDGYLSLPNVKTITPTAASHTHSYGTAWKCDGTNHWHECACGDKADTAAHTFKWVTDKEATATEKGSKHEECTVCGYKKAAAEIPATGSGSGSASQPTKPGSTGSPQTGDSSSVLWLAILCISGGVLTVLGIASRKKSKNALK